MVPCTLARHIDAIQWLIGNIIAVYGIQGTKISLNFYDSREGGREDGSMLCACRVPCVAMVCLV